MTVRNGVQQSQADMYRRQLGGTVEFETTSFDPDAARKLYKNGPTKLMFQADRLEDVVFRIGEKKYTIDFPALVRDYGKEVER